MKPQIYHVDAFTSEPFRGNSAGVVLHADTLSDAQMQLIARELRHSETAFLLKSEESDVRIRYFTPTVEVPICGHATVAAHYVRATVLGLGNTTVWQTSLAGRHRVEIHAEHNDYRITLEQGQPSFEPPFDGGGRAEIHGENEPSACALCGYSGDSGGLRGRRVPELPGPLPRV